MAAITNTLIVVMSILVLLISTTGNMKPNLSQSDVNLIDFTLNFEYLEAEFFLFGSLGNGLDNIDIDLAGGGPPPAGAKMANLSPYIRSIISQLAYQELGHLRAIKKTVKGFPRPFMNLSTETFATMMNNAFEKPLFPPFDPYANDINYVLCSYILPYVGLTGYVGLSPKLQSPISKRLVAGLLGVESGQDTIIRSLLYEIAHEKVIPYEFTVAEFTDKISKLRNRLGCDGIKDEGVSAPLIGTEGNIIGNILAGDDDSLSFGRTPQEVLRIMYGSGEEQVSGGFYPNGCNGVIAQGYLAT